MKKNQTEDKPVSFRFDKFSLIAVILAVVCLFSYAIVAVKLSIAENGVSVVSFLIIIAILLSVLFLRRNEKIRLNRFIKGLSAACLIAFGMEVFVFNFKSITTDNFEIPMNEISSIYAGNSEAATISSMRFSCSRRLKSNSSSVDTPKKDAMAGMSATSGMVSAFSHLLIAWKETPRYCASIS